MPFTVIEINDFQLSLHQDNVCFSELGYALVTNDEVLFGVEAQAKACLFPQNHFCHFWQQLGLEEVICDNNQINNFADLAYLQLKKLIDNVDNCDDVIFVVPTSYNQSQLSLLLGIAQSCNLNVLGLINKALVRFDQHCNTGKYAILDISLHHSSVTELLVNDFLTLGNVEQFAHKGITNLCKELGYWLNEQFILQHRYDAFCSAESEQLIHNLVQDLLSNREPSIDICLDKKKLIISARDVNQQIEQFFSEILAMHKTCREQGIQTYITSRFANICAELRKLDDIIELNDSCIYSLVKENLKYLTGMNGVSLVTRLPLLVNDEAKANTNAQREKISHIVCQGHAYPLNGHAVNLTDLITGNGASVQLEPNLAGWKLALKTEHQVMFNHQKAVDGQQIYLGDQLSFSIGEESESAVFTFIKVEQEMKPYGN